jgi:hypothetical protein
VQPRLLVLQQDPVPRAHPQEADAGRAGAGRDRQKLASVERNVLICGGTWTPCSLMNSAATIGFLRNGRVRGNAPPTWTHAAFLGQIRTTVRPVRVVVLVNVFAALRCILRPTKSLFAGDFGLPRAGWPAGVRSVARNPAGLASSPRRFVHVPRFCLDNRSRSHPARSTNRPAPRRQSCVVFRLICDRQAGLGIQARSSSRAHGEARPCRKGAWGVYLTQVRSTRISR